MLILILMLMLSTLPTGFANAEPVRIDEGIFKYSPGDCVDEIGLLCFEPAQEREMSEALTEGDLCMEELESCPSRAEVLTKVFVGVGIGTIAGLVIALLLKTLAE